MTIDGVPVDAAGQGMFVHAMQSGMRPNLVSSGKCGSKLITDCISVELCLLLG